MAFLADDPNQDPNDPNKAAAGAQIGGAGGTVGGGTIGGGASGAAASPTGTSSGAFTNLNAYVDANKGNDAQLGGAVTGTVDKSAKAADAAGSTFQTGANADIAAGTVHQDANVLGGLNTMGAGGTSDLDPTAFNSQYNANYTGKKSAQDEAGYGDTKQAYQDTNDLAGMATGDANQRGQVLQSTYGTGGKQYNSGERGLDSFILGAGDQGKAALDNIGSTYGNYTGNFDKISGLVDQGAAAGAAESAATKAATRAAAQNAFGSTEGRLDEAGNKAAAANDAASSKYQKLTSGDNAALKEYGYGDDAIAAMKNTPGGMYNYNQGVTKNSNYTVGDEAAAPDVANFQKLQSLVGGAGGALTGQKSYDFSKGGSGPSVDKNVVQTANTNAWNAKAAAETKAAADKQAAAQAETAAYNKRMQDVAAAEKANADAMAQQAAARAATVSAPDNGPGPNQAAAGAWTPQGLQNRVVAGGAKQQTERENGAKSEAVPQVNAPALLPKIQQYLAPRAKNPW